MKIVGTAKKCPEAPRLLLTSSYGIFASTVTVYTLSTVHTDIYLFYVYGTHNRCSETAREYEQCVPSLRTVEVYVAVKRLITRLPEVIWKEAASQGAVFK